MTPRLQQIKTLFHDPNTHQIIDNITTLLEQHTQLFAEITDELDSLNELNSYFVVEATMLADIKSACLYGEDYF